MRLYNCTYERWRTHRMPPWRVVSPPFTFLPLGMLRVCVCVCMCKGRKALSGNIRQTAGSPFLTSSLTKPPEGGWVCVCVWREGVSAGMDLSISS